MDYAFEFIINNGGIDTDVDYPYTGRDGKCDQYRVRKNFCPFFSAYKLQRRVTSNGLAQLHAAANEELYLSDLIVIFCPMQKNAKVVTIDSYEDVPAYDELALKKAAANQPISVAIEAGGRDFQFYESVITCAFNCSLIV